MTTPKPDAVEREPPKILGLSMTPIGVNSWVLELSNKLSARLDWRIGGYAGIAFGAVVAWGKSIQECIAAIEVELLAIRDAIPARAEEQAAKPPESVEMEAESCSLCDRGFPFLNKRHDIHIATQALGMIPSTPCRKRSALFSTIRAGIEQGFNPSDSTSNYAIGYAREAVAELERQLEGKQ